MLRCCPYQHHEGMFLHTHRDMRIPPTGPIYSFNEANWNAFEEPVRAYLRALKEGSSPTVGKKPNARYLGSLVADVHNILINGGIYGYPRTRHNPSGKLRLLYEACPMAGHMRILDVKPTVIHQRVTTFLGNIENEFELDQFFTYYPSDEEMNLSAVTDD